MDDDDEEEGVFPASKLVPGQAVSRGARQRLHQEYEHAQPEERYAWWEAYKALEGRGWTWRQAIYIAWACLPAPKRRPETQQELALLLGLRGDRVIRQWRAKYPEIDLEIRKEAMARVMDGVAGAVAAMVAVANTPEPAAKPDRQMLLEMANLYKPKVANEISGADGKAVEVNHVGMFTEFDDDELEGLIANLQAAERDAGGGAG